MTRRVCQGRFRTHHLASGCGSHGNSWGWCTQQLSLGVSGYASQQQPFLPVHKLVGEAMAAPINSWSHVGSLEPVREACYSRSYQGN